MVRHLSELFAEKPPDLVIPISRGALDFFMQYRNKLAPETPVVYCCTAASAAAALSLPKDVVGVVNQYDWPRTLDLAERLQPNASNLAVISGASPYDHEWLEDLRRAIEPRLSRYDVRYLTGLAYDKLLGDVADLPPNTIVLMAPVFTDGTGQTHVPPEAAAEIAGASSAPAYAPIDTFLGTGIVGGFMDSYEAHGIAMADLALQILNGVKPAMLPAQTTPAHTYRVDARQLNRWGLSERSLPANTVILFGSPTLWEEHRNALLAAAAAFGLQTILVGFLLVQMRRRKKAEAEAESQRKEVSHLMRVSVLGELSGAIAHELNQPLTAILAYAQAARRLLGGRSPEFGKIAEVLDEIVHEDNRASEVIRRLHGLLRKGESKAELVELNELTESTLALLRSETISRKVKLDLVLERDLPRVSCDPVQLQQVLLNLFVNAMDAMAGTAIAERVLTVKTLSTGGYVEVRVSDRGHGISDAQRDQIFKPFFTTKDHGLGLGLSICTKIVKAHGGKLKIDSNANGGVTASLLLPAKVAVEATS
jgi:signal transduction histidine kinase